MIKRFEPISLLAFQWLALFFLVLFLQEAPALSPLSTASSDTASWIRDAWKIVEKIGLEKIKKLSAEQFFLEIGKHSEIHTAIYTKKFSHHYFHEYSLDQKLEVVDENKYRNLVTTWGKEALSQAGIKGPGLYWNTEGELFYPDGRSAVFHELLEYLAIQSGQVDILSLMWLHHADLSIIEEELRFTSFINPDALEQILANRRQLDLRHLKGLYGGENDVTRPYIERLESILLRNKAC